MAYLFAAHNERGQALTEYSFLLVLVVVVVILILVVFGEQLVVLYSQIVADLPF